MDIIQYLHFMGLPILNIHLTDQSVASTAVWEWSRPNSGSSTILWVGRCSVAVFLQLKQTARPVCRNDGITSSPLWSQVSANLWSNWITNITRDLSFKKDIFWSRWQPRWIIVTWLPWKSELYWNYKTRTSQFGWLIWLGTGKTYGVGRAWKREKFFVK